MIGYKVHLDTLINSKIKVMRVNNKYNIGDTVYIKTDINQKPNIIIAITVYSDNYHTYKLNSMDNCSDYRDYEIADEKDLALKIENY